MRSRGRVGLTSVNANAASPQFDTVTDVDVVVPTLRWPNVSVSALVQMRGEASAGIAAQTTSDNTIAGRMRVKDIEGCVRLHAAMQCAWT